MQADARLALVARFHRPGIVGEGLVSRDEALAMADVVIDFTTPAQFERDLLIERTQSGLKRAKSEGRPWPTGAAQRNAEAGCS
ncbi:hypothetical protein [Mesorhizobium amorphae]|uniref:hypothetical protein n=1 Tax=Mesorhizobium amorphae TaxID=71433 RepID=UPI001FEE669B|nr:hypothetical protein [Mesorhizobium amorphae]